MGDIYDRTVINGVPFDGEEMVKHICEQIGYGRVMQIASNAWREKDPIGAFSTGHCFGTLDHAKEHGECAYCEQKLPKKKKKKAARDVRR